MTSATITLPQAEIFKNLVSVLGTFGLQSTGGAAIPIIRGLVNRVPEPNGKDFIVLWPIARDRLAMNIDTTIDVQATGSITANVLTVTHVTTGPLAAGAIYGVGVTAGCQIVAQLTGPAGGIGTYSTTATADVASKELYCGTISWMQETEITVQADVHGPASADNAQRISTLFRDQYAVDAFYAQNSALSSLYTSEPKQMSFDNGEQQVEERWVIDLCMQANISIITTMQFADKLSLASEVLFPGATNVPSPGPSGTRAATTGTPDGVSVGGYTIFEDASGNLKIRAPNGNLIPLVDA